MSSTHVRLRWERPARLGFSLHQAYRTAPQSCICIVGVVLAGRVLWWVAVCKTRAPDALQRLADKVLTWIEQREAEQVAYGLFDGTLTGADILAQFRPLDGWPVSAEERQTELPAALQYLAEQVATPPVDGRTELGRLGGAQPHGRDVRLLALLRQRIVRNDADQARHRLSSAKRLTGDVTLHDATDSQTLPWVREQLFQIINDRLLHKLATVVTTNLALDALDSRIGSRLYRAGVVISMKAEDYSKRNRT